MDAGTLLSNVFTKNSYKGAKAYVLCRETAPKVEKEWVEALKKAGMHVKSADDLLPGQDWAMQVEKWMEESDFVFALFDEKAATEAGWFQKFVRIAYELDQKMVGGHIKMIPIRLDEGALKSGYKFYWLDIWNEEAPKILKRTLARISTQ